MMVWQEAGVGAGGSEAVGMVGTVAPDLAMGGGAASRAEREATPASVTCMVVTWTAVTWMGLVTDRSHTKGPEH